MLKAVLLWVTRTALLLAPMMLSLVLPPMPSERVLQVR
jgi:hypothetical protein